MPPAERRQVMRSKKKSGTSGGPASLWKRKYRAPCPVFTNVDDDQRECSSSADHIEQSGAASRVGRAVGGGEGREHAREGCGKDPVGSGQETGKRLRPCQ